MSHEAIALQIHLIDASAPEATDDEAVFGTLSPRREPSRAARGKGRGRGAVTRSRPGPKAVPRTRR